MKSKQSKRCKGRTRWGTGPRCCRKTRSKDGKCSQHAPYVPYYYGILARGEGGVGGF